MGKPLSKLGTMLQAGRAFGMRDGILRLEYELQRGSGLMSWRMRSVQGWHSWDLKRIAPGVTAEDMRAARRKSTPRFFFSDAQDLAANIREIVGIDGQESVVAEAQRVLEGNLPFFGHLSFACGFPPQWFRNPVTGQSVSPQRPWTQMRFASPAYGDLKFVLEPSRFLFVYPLVRAYALSGNERFPRAFWNAVEDWARHSPPMAGPLWICGQECSLRILALSFALHGFIKSSSTTHERIALLVSMIAAHAWRTAQTLGYARSQRSNHLISEAVGLWTTGTLFPELREAQVWRNLGAQLLREAVLDQITPQGASQQHSFNYQRMILHLLLWTLRLAEIHGDNAAFDEVVRVRTLAAFDFMRAFVDVASGHTPNYGSNDGSLIFPLAHGSYRDFRPLLQLGAAVLNRPVLPPGPWNEAALWFGIKPAVVEKAAPSPAPAAETGYFRVGDETSWALVRAGHYVRRPFQADQLHADLWSQGINLARDAGTYLYNGPSPWNNGLARTVVHNTITLDGRDQMRRAGRFLWLDWAQGSGQVQTSLNQAWPDYFEGEHDGYADSGGKHGRTIHRRMIHWLSGAGWVIVDDMEGVGMHGLRLHWLAADLPYVVSDVPFQIVFASKKSQVRWSIFSSVPGNAAVVRAGRQAWASSKNNSAAGMIGEDTALLGWESSTYGELSPAISLVYQTRSQLPVRFVTVVLTDEGCHLKQEEDDLVICKARSNSNSRNEFKDCRVTLSAKATSLGKSRPVEAGVPRT